MNPDIIINVILTIFLGQTLDSGIWMLLSALTLAGLFGVFRKSGLKGWEALIPCLREAKLGEIAGREKEGRVAAVTQGLTTLLNVAILFVPENTVRGDRALDLIAVSVLLVSIIQIIYSIRIYLGLIEVYGRRRRWVLLWTFADVIPACLWGWSKKYQPQWTLAELQGEADRYFSGSRAAVLDQGLTVNLEEIGRAHV